MGRIVLDTETCGLHGIVVLLQYAEDDGEIHLHEVWKQPVHKTLQLLRYIADREVIGFNLVFDWFHLAKLYTLWSLLPKNWVPEKHINEIAAKEKEARDGPCLKPRKAMDLLLHSRNGPFQSLMSRDDIRITKIPTPLSYALAEELEKLIEFDEIYFARSKDKDAPKWRVYDRKAKDILDPEFKDVVLKFNPAGGLKFLAEHALGRVPKYHYTEVELDTSYRPQEIGFAPFAEALSSEKEGWEVWKIDKQDGKNKFKGYAWPGVIEKHIEHWHTHAPAREYATDDIVYTRDLWKYFDKPEAGDDDSELACMVGAVRWHGFIIDEEGIKELLEDARNRVATAPININKHWEVRQYIMPYMCELEIGVSCIDETTNKKTLETIAKYEIEIDDEECLKCGGCGTDLETMDPCLRCGGKGIMTKGPHPAAIRAEEILDVKVAAKEIELYAKLLAAGRFHASFNVIGTLSSRMSGADGLNPQGIKKEEFVRNKFPLKWDNYILCGGDFNSFEVVIAEAVFGDENLRKDLQAGKKIHALLAQQYYEKTYEEVMFEKGKKMYKTAKGGIFGFMYGGDHTTWVKRLGWDLVRAEKTFEGLQTAYPGIKKARGRIQTDFCSMTQPGGIGSQVVWKEPKDFCETFLGYRRYYTLENKICSALFGLAQKPPKKWRKCDIKVCRRDRMQTASGAVQSAIFGAAFQIQARNMRSANNHLIQSPGAQITKRMQRRIWDIQPHGANEWLVAPMNIHDEVMCVTHPSVVKQVTHTAQDVVEQYRADVPLIGITWDENMEHWAGLSEKEQDKVIVQNVIRDEGYDLIEFCDATCASMR